MMKKRLSGTIAVLALGGLLVVGCGTADTNAETLTKQDKNEAVQATAEKASKKTKGERLTKVLSGTNWQGTRVYDQNNNDLTAENQGFIGLAKYDGATGYYEFFDKATGATRGDEGTFFITADGNKRILISATMNYQAVVEVTKLDKKVFTYKRIGKDKTGQDVEVFVEHVPDTTTELEFTHGRGALTTTTGPIETKVAGDQLLGSTLWNGTKVLDEAGNDVTAANQMFISLAKFEAATNKYEFFDLTSGNSRGDFGYFAVLVQNKLRAHVSIGTNKYGAALEITEINAKKFTYKRMGKDNNNNNITVFVEHEPYKGSFKPNFSF